MHGDCEIMEYIVSLCVNVVYMQLYIALQTLQYYCFLDNMQVFLQVGIMQKWRDKNSEV